MIWTILQNNMYEQEILELAGMIKVQNLNHYLEI